LNRVPRLNHRLDCEALESRQLLAGFYIINDYSGKLLDDPGASPNNFALIDQYRLNGAGNQRWYLDPLPDGNYEIRNEASGLVLDNSFSGSEGTKIDQFQDEFQSSGGLNLNQQWQLTLTPDESLGNGYDCLSGIVNAYSGEALDNSLSTSDGYVIDQWPFYGGPNQEWRFIEAGDAPPATYNIFNAAIGLSFEDPADQLHIAGVTNPPTAWDFAPLANNSYLIVSESSGSILNGSGTSVGLTQLNGTLNQQWRIDPVVNGTSAIVNESNQLVVDQIPSNAYYVLDQFQYEPTQGWFLTLAPPAGVDIHGQPSNAVVGQPISPAITVAVVGAKGNTITTNNTQLVTLAIASGPAGAKLLGTTTVRAVNGVADFTNLRLSLAGTYTLTATGGMLTPDFSNVFTVAPANVTSEVTIRPGSVHTVGRSNGIRNAAELVTQTITIKNTSRHAIGGPLALRVGGLPSGVTLANATGTYEGGSYRDVLAALHPLAPGKSVTVTLDFSVRRRRVPSLSKLDEDLEALLGI
jgi:hypothetical protein